MEKLIQQWQERKDPGHLAGRAGSFVCIALLSLVALSHSAAAQSQSQSHGHPAKAVRILAPDTRNTAPAHSLPDPRFVDAETVTLSDPEPVMVIEAKRPRQRPNTILVTDGPYLPVAGAPPLRFASARGWPPPLPDPAPAAASDSAPVASQEKPRSGDTLPAQVVSDLDAAAPDLANPAPETSPGARNLADGTPLTADMVLGFLGDMPARETRVPVRFEPAIPAGAASAGGPLSP